MKLGWIIFGGVVVYGLIIARNKAREVPQLTGDQLLLTLPPIPLGTIQAGGEVIGKQNLFRIVFGSEIRYNSEQNRWELVIPPLIIDKSQIQALPNLIKQIVPSLS